MTIVVKEYYRLSELERYFGISEDDVKYLVENDKIRLSLFCSHAKFIVGEWIDNKDSKTKFCGNSVVNYQGAIELSPTEYQKLKASANYLLYMPYCSRKIKSRLYLKNTHFK